MRIGLDNRAIRYSGIGVYISNLTGMQHNAGHYVALYEDGLEVSRASFIYKYVNLLRRICKEQFGLQTWVIDKKVEIYHATKNIGVPVWAAVPVIVTIHDIIPHVFPKQYLNNFFERIYYETAIRISLSCSNKIITISEFSKNELMKHYGIQEEKIAVIPLAHSPAFSVCKDNKLLKQISEKYKLHRPYILAIGGSEYRKNIQRLINVYQQKFFQDYQLIILGKQWRNVDLADKYAQNSNIRFLTDIPEQDLVGIYNLAAIFVFPSFYEGFGIPVLESMACGVPVAASNMASLPEVGGDAAVYFDPFDENDMAEKIGTVLNDAALREMMVARGLNRVKKFSWEKCAQATIKVYEDVLRES